MEKKPSVTILCLERWNTERLAHIKQLTTLKKETVQQLDKLSLEPDVLRFRVRYTTKKGDALSRVYGNLVYHGPAYRKRCQQSVDGYVYESEDHPLEDEYNGGASLQTLPTWIRRLISSQYYRDFDVVSCAPTILSQILVKEGLTVPTPLSHYNMNRNALFEKYRHVATQGEIKCAFLEVIHMGKVDERFKETQDLKLSLRATLLTLTQRSPLYKELYASRLNKVSGSTKQKYASLSGYSKISKALGKFCAVVWQREEHAVLMSMRRFFITEQGCNPLYMVLSFDGLMIERTVDERPVELPLLNAHILKETGYVVQVIEKSMRPTRKDWDLYNGKEVQK